ncbi:glutathione S-transferase [Vibrio rotiferianus]|nr:glutathione S-transferase [Vibrio rotiferianus]
MKVRWSGYYWSAQLFKFMKNHDLWLEERSDEYFG